MTGVRTSYLLLIAIVGCVLLVVSPKCTDRPQCFKKLMFNFNFPEMNLFEIKSTTEITQQYMMKAYGDFNNDLFSDFIAVNQQHQFLVFVWNNDLYLYQKVFTTKITDQIIPKTLYLVDVSGDGRQDIVVWGEKLNEKQQTIENCLVAFVRQQNMVDSKDEEEINYDFKETAKLTSNPTTDPIAIGHKLGSPTEGVGFLMVLNSTRYFIKYFHLSNVEPVLYKINQYQSEKIQWSTIVINGDSYSGIQFLDPHWNSLVDLTGDCRPDLIILNEKEEIQVWIGEDEKFKLSKVIKLNETLGNHLAGMSFSDLDYDGAIDLLIVLESEIMIYHNTHSLTLDDSFCTTKNQDVTFATTPIKIVLPAGHKMKRQSLHLGDINIDGYPDLFVIVIDQNNGREIPMLYENQFQNGGNLYPFEKPNFNNGVLSAINTTTGEILSVSFIDILQNGILDMIITYKSEGKYLTKTFYNNYLCQNDYFIKGYGLLGPSITYGSQYPGMSFYWLNSVNDGYKISYSAQIIQSAYDSLQLPYAFSGLGKTNNYVESFTIGRNGISQQWSPIIPNSQLGVFTTHDAPEEWKIRIFSFPFYELIAVIICTSVILTIFGVYLMYRKCKGYGKKQESLEIQFIN